MGQVVASRSSKNWNYTELVNITEFTAMSFAVDVGQVTPRLVETQDEGPGC